MVNWQDPEMLLRTGRAFEFIVFLALGVYFWEMCCSIRFDIACVTGRIKFRWTLVPYMLARYFLLLALIAGVRVINVFEPIDCLAWNRLIYSCAHICIALSSLLLVLRVIAITERNKYIMAVLGTLYTVNLGSLIHGVTLTQAVYFPPLYACAALNTVASRVNMWVALSFDTVCLLVLLGALWREPGGNFWKFLFKQGFIYFIIVTMSYLVCVVFLTLNLNDAMNELPQTIALTTLVMCATRMYRDLVEYDTRGHVYDTTTGTKLWFGEPSTPGASRPFASAFSTSPATPSRASITIQFRKPETDSRSFNDKVSKNYMNGDDMDLDGVAVLAGEDIKFAQQSRPSTHSEGSMTFETTGSNIGTFGSEVGAFTVDTGVGVPGAFPPGQGSSSDIATMKTSYTSSIRGLRGSYDANRSSSVLGVREQLGIGPVETVRRSVSGSIASVYSQDQDPLVGNANSARSSFIGNETVRMPGTYRSTVDVSKSKDALTMSDMEDIALDNYPMNVLAPDARFSSINLTRESANTTPKPTTGEAASNRESAAVRVWYGSANMV